MKVPFLLLSIAAIVFIIAFMAGENRDERIQKKLISTESYPTTPTASEPSKDMLKTIDAEKLQLLIATDPKLLIIDVRRIEDYQTGHIPASRSLRAIDINEESLASFAPTHDVSIVFYGQDNRCPGSLKAAYKAAKLGYKHLYRYKNGLFDWQQKELPVASAR